MDGAILLVVAIGALGAFMAGIVLLVLYFRAGRGDHMSQDEPVVYGNLVQCSRCGYMNPLESAACLNPNCRAPLPHPPGYQPPSLRPTYLGDGPPQPAPHYRQAPAANSPPAPPAPQQPVQPARPPADRPPDMPNAWLEGVSGAMQGKSAILQQGDTLVGRSTVCDVQIFDPKVSRKHFRIRYGNGAFYLQDQQSSRGTTINGQRVMAQKLNDGDRIVIGDTTLLFHVEQ